MLDYLIGFGGGVCITLITLRLYIRGKLLERWYISGRTVDGGTETSRGYEVLLKKGTTHEVVIYRVLFDRFSSPNPDNTFADQLAQARADAEQKAAAMNANERLTRDTNRKHGTPGGIV